MQFDLPLKLERDLVAGALAFRAAEPWKFLGNTHYLLVTEADDNLRALSVLGQGRQQYGLQCYAASCAVEWLLLVEMSSPILLTNPTLVYEILEAETLDLGARKDTDLRDRERLSRSGYEPVPRARQAWPFFRQFRPNHLPWHVDEAAARRLLTDLHRALRWAELAPSLDWSDLAKPIALRRFPRVSAELSADRPWTPADVSWDRLPRVRARHPEPLPVDPAKVAAVKRLPVNLKESLWVDERPQMVEIGPERDGLPYFPRIGVCLDGRTGMAFPPAMGSAARPIGTSALESLVTTLQARGSRPGNVLIANDTLAITLGPWLQAAGIASEHRPGGEVLDGFWEMMDRF